ncbi:MAG: hypothetical protein ISS46_01235 [Candidatus Omnitrophica bacterium]|nr:hypothetical protein [Candidatus Omnitrophota bacterium]
MNRFLKVLVVGVFLVIAAPSWAIMSGNPVGVMKEEAEHNQGQLSLETNFIFESDISPDNSDNNQTEEGQWVFLKGTVNVNDFLDFYVRLGTSHLEHKDTTADIEEKMEWGFAFGGGFMLRLYEYEPWGFKLILDGQYYGTCPDIEEVKFVADGSTVDIYSASYKYKENNIQTSLLSQLKAGPFFPYIGVTFAHREISNKFTVNSVEYDLSGENKNKVGITAGFDFPFDWEDIISGTGILSVEGRFFDEFGVSVGLTNRF